MKCLHCGHDSKYKERPNKACPHCHRYFAFEPREGDIITDVGFQNAIAAVSAKGQLRWGVENLYYELCRRKRKPPSFFIILGCLLAAFGVVALIVALSPKPVWWLGVIGAALGGIVTAAAASRARFVPVDAATFRAMYERWCKVHETPPGAIIRQPPPSQPKPLEPDVADYSFDRAVICDRARTVDLLLANHFHFENNCAVLSVEGYPPGPFETVRAMLKRNPRLQVFALHDASENGCRLAHKLATDPAWFGGKIRVFDVGLRPSQCGRFRGLLLSSTAAQVVPGNGITPKEAVWLAQYTLELAAIRPEQMLKRLFRAINRKFDPKEQEVTDDGVIIDGGGGGDVEHDSVSIITFATDSDGGGDSFG